MQHSIKLKLSEQQQQLLKKDSDNISSVLFDIIPAYSDQIGYMLQPYHPRQKVSKVEVAPASISLLNTGSVNLKIHYVLEEYSACSAIDTEEKEIMSVTVTLDARGDVLNLVGAYWPSLD